MRTVRRAIEELNRYPMDEVIAFDYLNRRSLKDYYGVNASDETLDLILDEINSGITYTTSLSEEYVRKCIREVIGNGAAQSTSSLDESEPL